MELISDEDTEFIKNELELYDKCNFSQGNQKIIPADISIKTLEKILKTGITDGPNMETIKCLIKAILFADKSMHVNQFGIYTPSDTINNWVKFLDVKNNQDFYDAYITHESIPVKIRQVFQSANNYTFHLEYLIGLVLNNLRYLIPNFVYTLGSFMCTEPSIDPDTGKVGKICSQKGGKNSFIIYQNLNGIILRDGIKKGKITVLDWMPIFGMILLALEVAQRECRFTHYGLDTRNVMLVENVPDYEVVLDGIVYKIIKPKYVPVLMDFSNSSIKTNGTELGLSLETYINKYMIPDFDMYWFIYNSLVVFREVSYVNPDLILLENLLSSHRHGRHLFQRLDLYLEKDIVGSPEYKSDISDKLRYFLFNIPGASETPIQLFKRFYWDFSDILNTSIVPTKREKLYSLKYTSSVKSYYDILSKPRKGLEQMMLNVEKCIKITNSFLLSKYQLYTLENYNKTIKSKSLDSLISDIRKSLVLDEIKIDMKKLYTFFDIPVPDSDWADRIHTITSIMPYDVNSSVKSSGKRYLTPLIKYIKQVKPYFDMYFTILELGLDIEHKSTYGVWVKNFRESDSFKFYGQNIDFITEGIRWCKVLDGSNHVDYIDKMMRETYPKTPQAIFWSFLFEKDQGEMYIKKEAGQMLAKIPGENEYINLDDLE